MLGDAVTAWVVSSELNSFWVEVVSGKIIFQNQGSVVIWGERGVFPLLLPLLMQFNYKRHSNPQCPALRRCCCGGRDGPVFRGPELHI